MSMPTAEEFRRDLLAALPGADLGCFRYTKNGLGMTAVLNSTLRELKYVRWAKGRYCMSHGDGATVEEAVLSLRRWLVYDGKTQAVFWLDHMRRPST